MCQLSFRLYIINLAKELSFSLNLIINIMLTKETILIIPRQEET